MLEKLILLYWSLVCNIFLTLLSLKYRPVKHSKYCAILVNISYDISAGLIIGGKVKINNTTCICMTKLLYYDRSGADLKYVKQVMRRRQKSQTNLFMN